MNIKSDCYWICIIFWEVIKIFYDCGDGCTTLKILETNEFAHFQRSIFHGMQNIAQESCFLKVKKINLDATPTKKLIKSFYGN